jgi:SAM-dependent methyltransferase
VVVSLLTHTDLDHPEAAFAEAARVLRQGGRLSYVGTHPCFVTPFVERRPQRGASAPSRLSPAWLAPCRPRVRRGDPSPGRRAPSAPGRPARRRAWNRGSRSRSWRSRARMTTRSSSRSSCNANR